VRLRGIVNVALEKDDAAGAKRVEHDSQSRRHGRAVKAHDEQLADLVPKFEAAFGSHKE
jgi:hypothetical protein